jgi:hypothetical protein
VFVFTDKTKGQVVATVEGTGIACSIFSGIWALANQHAHRALGQAAPLISRMPAHAFHDIVAVGSATDPSGIFVDPLGNQSSWTPAAVFAPYPVPSNFFSAILNDRQGQVTTSPDVWAIWGWGLGGTLTVAPGWDNMTGFGTPNGMAFLNAAAHEQGGGDDQE